MNEDERIQADVDELIKKYDLSVQFNGDYRMSIVGEQGSRELGMAQIIPRALLYDEDADELLRQIRLEMWNKMSHMMYRNLNRRW